MSKNVSKSSTQQVVSRRTSQATPSYKEKMFWYMRWFALIILSTGYISSIVTGIIGFSITRDPRFLLFISPTLFTPAIFYLVPMDDKTYELKKLRIQATAQRRADKWELLSFLRNTAGLSVRNWRKSTTYHITAVELALFLLSRMQSRFFFLQELRLCLRRRASHRSAKPFNRWDPQWGYGSLQRYCTQNLTCSYMVRRTFSSIPHWQAIWIRDSAYKSFSTNIYIYYHFRGRSLGWGNHSSVHTLHLTTYWWTIRQVDSWTP